jgi:hypothetical protein
LAAVEIGLPNRNGGRIYDFDIVDQHLTKRAAQRPPAAQLKMMTDFSRQSREAVRQSTGNGRLAQVDGGA